MKKLLFALVPIAFLAASSNHQAFGPIHFGMRGGAYVGAQTQLLREMHSTHKDAFTAATARKYFVTNANRFAPRLEAKDSSIAVVMETKPAHPGVEGPVSEISVSSAKQPAATFSSLKEAWEVFQDIGDCKLQRVGPRGQFSRMEDIALGADVVTDTWEGEGIRIELLLRAVADPANPDTQYETVLRATEIPVKGISSR
jgi:hypothetical protein